MRPVLRRNQPRGQKQLWGVLCALGVGLFSSAASATETPGFSSLDRADSGSRVELSLSSPLYEDGPTWAGRADLYGQFTTKRGAGGYVSLPVSFVRDTDTTSGLGNLELGGLFKTGGRVPVVLRAGIVLDTAPDSFENTGANLTALFGRFTELPTITPNQKWLRLGASPMWRHRSFFFRADAGLDFPIPKENGADPLLRFNAGAGFDFGGSAGTLELSSYGTTGDPGNSDRFLHLFTLGIRRSRGQLRPYASLGVPLNDSLDFINGVFVIGLQVHVDR